MRRKEMLKTITQMLLVTFTILTMCSCTQWKSDPAEVAMRFAKALAAHDAGAIADIESPIAKSAGGWTTPTELLELNAGHAISLRCDHCVTDDADVTCVGQFVLLRYGDAPREYDRMRLQMDRIDGKYYVNGVDF